MLTNDERRKVAARLRELPCIPSELDQWKGRELFLEPSRYDEADYAQIHRILLGCFPADIMHPCDYEDLHNRLAELIEPEERTCRIYDTDHGFEDSIRCNACQMTFRRPWQPFKFCPNCGAKVLQE